MNRLLSIVALLSVAIIATVLGVNPLGFAQTTPQSNTTTVTVSWQEATPNVTFNVYRWNAGQNGFTKINAAPITTLTYDDTTAVVGTTYSYKVSAVSGKNESAQSAEKDITISAPITVPAVPTNLKVTVVITN